MEEAFYYLAGAAALFAAATLFALRGSGPLARVAVAYFLADAIHAAGHGAGGLTSDPATAQALVNLLHIPSYAGLILGGLFFSRFAGVHERFWWNPITLGVLSLVPIALIAGELLLATPYYTYSPEGAHAVPGTHAQWMGLYGFGHFLFDLYFVGLAAVGLARTKRSSLAAGPALLLAYAIVRQASVFIEFATLPSRWAWLSGFGLPQLRVADPVVWAELAAGFVFALGPLLIVRRAGDPNVRTTGYAAIGLATIFVTVVALGAGPSVPLSNMRLLFGLIVLAYASFRHGLLGARHVGAPRFEGAAAAVAFGLFLALSVATLAATLPGWAALAAGLAAAPAATALLLQVSGIPTPRAFREGHRGELAPGRVFFDRYQVLRALDALPTPAVFLARDRVTDRDVVLKRRQPEPGGYEAARREVDALGRISHPHVIGLIDVCETPHGLVVVLEHAAGGSLEERIRGRGKPDDAEFARIGEGLLAGLAAVHVTGIVHRDVKPSNVLLSRKGEAKLADFNTARLPDVEATLVSGGLVPTLIGSLRYMSPEQARSRAPTFASDVYSAALTLYELRTGKPAVALHPGENALDVLRRAAMGPHLAFDDADPYTPWFRHALDEDPARRPRNGSEALAAFRLVLEKTRGPESSSDDAPSRQGGSGARAGS